MTTMIATRRRRRHQLTLLVAFSGALLAIVYQWALLPGEPSWMDRHEAAALPDQWIKEQEQRQQHHNTDFSVQRFVGGDGVTTLVGRLYLPSTITTITGESTADNNNNHSNNTTLQPPPPPPPPPIVIMAHGLGLTQDCAYERPFVQGFRAAGLAVLTFDYATFGGSGGWPRHQVIPQRHVADLQAAVAHIRHKNHLGDRRTGVVDIHKIALWGTSLGGGHVLSVAAMDPEIQAVVATVPHIKSGLESILDTIRRDPYPASLGLVKVSAALLKWMLQKTVGMILPSSFFNLFFDDTTTELYIPLHGLPGSSAMMQNPGDDEGYGSLVKEHLHPEDSSSPSSSSLHHWKNLASVSSVLPTLLYRPFNTIHQVSCPTLLFAAERDTLCPAAHSVEAMRVLLHSSMQQGDDDDDNDDDVTAKTKSKKKKKKKKINKASSTTSVSRSRLRIMPSLGHFDVYQEGRPRALSLLVRESVDFFREHLRQ